MPLKTDEENAKLAHRQLDRQTEGSIPASDVGELEVYIQEGYERLIEMTDEVFAPKTYAVDLAQKAVRSWAKWQYSEADRYFAEWQSDAQRWKKNARAQYHKDDLETGDRLTAAEKYRAQISHRTNHPHTDSPRTTP